VLAISSDNLESHERFAQVLGGLPYPLLCDTELQAINAYGVLNDKGTGARRSIFVVDQKGIVRYANTKYEVSNPAHFEAIFTALGELRDK
jgi:peroxiredoxin